jgi:hypothetical protein
VKVDEIGKLLRLLERHPRVASLTVDGVRVELREAAQVVITAPAPAPDAHTEAAAEADGPLELPEGVLDVAAKIRALNAKYARERGGKPS